MQSKKLWQAFAVILGYMLFVTCISWLTQALFTVEKLPKLWIAPFVLGCICIIASIVLTCLKDRLTNLSPLTMCLNAAACGLFIGAYLSGKAVAASFSFLLLGSVSIGGFFLILICFLSVSPLIDKNWYIILSFFVWLIILIVGVCLIWHLKLTTVYSKTYFWCLIFFTIAAIGLALGAMLSSDDFKELLYAMLIPCSVSVGFIGIIVLLALAGGDGCDCDCGDCGDCCDCSTGYGGKRQKHTSFRDLSNGK